MQPLTGFLRRLRKDVRGNTLALVAAAVIPLIGMIGGGLDLSRMYIVKTRLQHACDAGALAGRRAMGGGTWTQSSNLPGRTATLFFQANIGNDAYGATNVTSNYTESAGRVTGTASADLSMTLMRVFGYETATLTANCNAEMRLPNTDVMFVLDVTGSMNDTLPGDSQNKIAGLRTAVRCFYEILARLDTEAVCDGDAPSGGTGSETQIRFGFVPYSTNVNVGRLLRTEWMADEWTYQSRAQTTVWGVLTGSGTASNGNKSSWSGWTSHTASAVDRDACQAAYPNATVASPTSQTFTGGTNERFGGVAAIPDGRFDAVQPYQDTQTEYVSFSSGTCTYRTRTRTYGRTLEFRPVVEGTPNALSGPAWRYRPVEFDISGLKNGGNWRASVDLPVGNNYTTSAVAWGGCIEERQTVRAASYWPIPSGAFDLDINHVPDSEASRWGPALQNVSYVRRENSSNSSAYDLDEITTFTNFSRGGYACPGPARRLQEWPTAADFDDYVDTLQPTSNTYHDIGLIWGARLIAPHGLFEADNEFTPEGGEIERHIIFMTDGEACTGITNYAAYGIAWFDRRQTDAGTAPTDGCLTTGSLTQQVNARTAAICEAIKNENITLWVIWFGTTQATIEGQMRSCATPDRFFSARNSVQLQQTFRSIANQISQLRLTS